MLTIKVNNKQIAIYKKNGKYVFNGWITVKKDHSNEDETGRHLFVKDGETPKEAMKRAWGVDLDKKKQAEIDKKQERRPRDEWQEEAERLGGRATAVKVGVEKALPPVYSRKELSQNIADSELVEEIMQAYKTLRPEAWRIEKLDVSTDEKLDLLEKLKAKSDEIENKRKKAFEESKNIIAERQKQDEQKAKEKKEATINDYKKYTQKLLEQANNLLKDTDDLAHTYKKSLEDEINRLKAKVLPDNELNKLNMEEIKFERQQLDRFDLERTKQNYIEATKAERAKKEKEKENKKTNKDYKVLKESKYSSLIERNGAQAWIPKNKINAKGELTNGGIEIFEDNAIPTEYVKRENSEREKGVQLPDTPDFESELAYGYNVPVTIESKVYSRRSGRYIYPLTQKTVKIYIPKSMIKDGHAPTWLVEDKLEKAGNLFFRPGQDGEWEPKSHGRVKHAFGKKTYTEQGHLKMAFTKEYEDRIKPDPDFEY